MKLVDYYKTKRTDLGNNYDFLDEKVVKMNENLVKLNSKLETNTKNEEKTSKGKLIIQVMNDLAGSVDFDINYITNNATWKPFYDLRATTIAEPIDMSYKAEVTQNTGIDWKKVKLSLSSGNPNQNNQQPELGAWFLQYQQQLVKTAYGISKRKDGYDDVSSALKGKVSGVNITDSSGAVGASSRIVLRGASSISGDNKALYVINGIPVKESDGKQLNPGDIKTMNVLKGEQAIALYGSQGANGVILITTKQMSDYTNIDENQLNISFDIDLPYDILSNGKAHSVALKEIKLPASYKYYAAPKIEKEAFLLAEIKDYAKYNLLQGEANIIFESMYVGKTVINPNQTADTLSLSMGRDKKIAIKREKVIEKCSTKFLSAKKEQVFTYDITVRNNKKETIDLLLKDQYPLTSDKEIEVEVLDNGNASENKETGILTWNLQLKPQEVKKIRISYKVRYPKDKIVGNL
jgi:TonB-dependent SusC/RagA subfamily outer membrane receptor